jgi:hypothetical protein
MASLRDNGTQLYLWLKADDDITGLLDTIGSYPAIIMTKMVNEEYQDLTMLQVYRMSTIEAVDINPVTYTINCRASTEVKADTIAQAVYNSINRKIADDKMAKCMAYPCIYEDVNHYNTPIDVVMYNNL